MTNSPSQPNISLRERKKLKTKAHIQACALELFANEGYATTIERIAAAAEVSPSTFFRYYPNKESVVLYDSLDQLLFTAVRDQPTNLNTIKAVRTAVQSIFTSLTPEQRQRELRRAKLVQSTPALRSAILAGLAENINLLANAIAHRTKRRPDDLAVRSLAGAIVGTAMALFIDDTAPEDYLKLFDHGLATLENEVRL